MDKGLLSEANQAIINAFKYGKCIVAFSGGKDGLVVADMVNCLFPNTRMVCETSFYFPEQLADIKKTASKLNFDVTYTNSLSEEWLLRNKHIIFSDNSKVRAQTFLVRQQNTIKKFAKKEGAQVSFTGRRTEENSVKKILYNTKKNGLQCHPLRNWKESDVWDYLKYRNIEKPYIYNTLFGESEGNAPFYSLNKKYFNGDVEKCWSVVREASASTDFERKFKS